MSKIKVAFALYLILIPIALNAVDDKIKFDRISREEGLSNSIVYSILEDEKGFLWFGTPDGLNKYDGQEFTVYKSNLNDARSIPNSSAGNIFIDSRGALWIGTWGGGLIRFDLQLETFTSFTHREDDDRSISGNRVQSLFEDSQGNYWFGTYKGGLNLFNPETEDFISFQNKDGDHSTISHNRIWSIIEDNDGTLWIGTSAGLNHYNQNEKSFHTIEGTEDFIIRNLLVTEDETLWFGTNDGLFQYDKENRKLIDTEFDNRIYSLYEDSKGIMWLGTSDGLVRYDYKEKTHKRYTHVPENYFSLSENSVRAIFEDSSGTIWIGTDGGGLCKFNNNPNDFAHHYVDKSREANLIDNTVYAFESDRDGKIWVGTMEGLQLWDRKANTFVTHFKDEIRALKIDPSGDLWIGSRNGLIRYSVEDEAFVTYDFPISEIRTIYLDDTNRLWIGTYKNGVFIYDIDNDVISKMDKELNHREIWSIVQDSSGDIWIGTGEGLNRIEKESGEIKSYMIDESDSSSLLGIRVFTIFEDSKKDIWIGTDEGLNRWYKDSDSFFRLTTENGLADKSVKSILEDGDGNLWLGSNDGLTRYNAETGIGSVYNIEDNLQGREFNENSVLATDDGFLLIGGLHGFNIFNPESIKESSYSPPIVLTGFSVKGQSRSFDNSISYIHDIDLTYKENFFTFEFIALDFTSSGHNKYAYKLEGVDEDWIYITDRNHVSYTNINGGDYTFTVKAANSDNIWNDSELKINISISSPPWRRWWAYLSYFVLLSTMVSAVLIWKTGKHRKEIAIHKSFVDKLEEKVLERTVELKLVNKKLERLSNIDDLTSLYNRRYFEKQYYAEWNRLQRVQLPISVLMCDIDHFKLYNDYYGHQSGDRCIQEVSKIITEHCVRPTDLAVRYGGEEFLVILPQTDADGAMNVANSIRESIEGKKMKHNYSSASSYVTISIGVASIIPDQEIPPLLLVENADKALYECKDGGRNKVSLYIED